MAIVNQQGLHTHYYFLSHLPGDALPNYYVSLGFRIPGTARVYRSRPAFGEQGC